LAGRGRGRSTGLFRLYSGSGVSQIQYLCHLCTRGIYKAPIEGGVLFNPRVRALILGQDLRVGIFDRTKFITNST
jgi:hypothetical protein